MKNRLLLLALLATALMGHELPLVSWPFSWLETFFHEISHGLAALLTGGEVRRIELNLNGSGLCVTAGGIRFFVTFSGYLGSVVWGGLLFRAALACDRKEAGILAALLLGLLGVAALLWARDGVTLLILALLMTIVGLALRFRETVLPLWLLRFWGLYVMTDAVRAPLVLVDGRNIGDGATLAAMTHVPEILWVLAWEGVALAGIWWLFRQAERQDRGGGEMRR